MARIARLWEPGGIYHVDARAHGGDPIFEDASEREFVLARAARVFAEEDVACYGASRLGDLGCEARGASRERLDRR